LKVFSGAERSSGVRERELLRRVAGASVVEVCDAFNFGPENVLTCTVLELWDKPLRAFINDVKFYTPASSWPSKKMELQRQVSKIGGKINVYWSFEYLPLFLS
jgi:hypothetical protein